MDALVAWSVATLAVDGAALALWLLVRRSTSVRLF